MGDYDQHDNGRRIGQRGQKLGRKAYSKRLGMELALVGTVLGAYLPQRLSDKWFYLLVQIGLFGVSVKLMVNASGWAG